MPTLKIGEILLLKNFVVEYYLKNLTHKKKKEKTYTVMIKVQSSKFI